ncbi:hypothetical protein C8R46DRAFT_1234820 [Mycena filopes]|nr:hypothetical protein C8R46DRAFT_1234820 [Mycena filopes]
MAILRTCTILLLWSFFYQRVQASLFPDAVYASMESVTSGDPNSLFPDAVPDNSFSLYGRVMCQPGLGQTGAFLSGDASIYLRMENEASVYERLACTASLVGTITQIFLKLAIYSASNQLTELELYAIYCTANKTTCIIVASTGNISSERFQTLPKPGGAARYYSICTWDFTSCWAGELGGSQLRLEPKESIVGNQGLFAFNFKPSRPPSNPAEEAQQYVVENAEAQKEVADETSSVQNATADTASEGTNETDNAA